MTTAPATQFEEDRLPRPGSASVLRMLDEARQHNQHRPGDYPLGVIDALAWTRGHALTAPLSGTRTSDAAPGMLSLLSEYEHATRVVSGCVRSALPFGYVVGVQAALMWVTGQTPSRPMEFYFTTP